MTEIYVWNGANINYHHHDYHRQQSSSGYIHTYISTVIISSWAANGGNWWWWRECMHTFRCKHFFRFIQWYFALFFIFNSISIIKVSKSLLNTKMKFYLFWAFWDFWWSFSFSYSSVSRLHNPNVPKTMVYATQGTGKTIIRQ